jgi:hypothetical protein
MNIQDEMDRIFKMQKDNLHFHEMQKENQPMNASLYSAVKMV